VHPAVQEQLSARHEASIRRSEEDGGGGDIVRQSTPTEWSVARVVGHLLRIGDAGIIDSELLLPDGMELLECRSLERAGDEGIVCEGIGVGVGVSVGVIEASSLIRKDLPTIESMFLNLAERVAGQGIDDV
jgi:hypothetical protein